MWRSMNQKGRGAQASLKIWKNSSFNSSVLRWDWEWKDQGFRLWESEKSPVVVWKIPREELTGKYQVMQRWLEILLVKILSSDTESTKYRMTEDTVSRFSFLAAIIFFFLFFPILCTFTLCQFWNMKIPSVTL